MSNRVYQVLTTVLLAGAVLGAFIANMVLPDRDFSPEENRMLQTLPSFSMAKYLDDRLENSMEAYANDQFLRKDDLVHIKKAWDESVGELESNGVIRCSDKYLMEDITVPEKTTLIRTENAILKFQQRYPKVPMYFLLAPNAANVLRGKLPLTVETHEQNNDIDAFFRTMKSGSITPIDVRPAFEEKRDSVQLYYRTDHHWTSDGAWEAYQVAADVMKLKSGLEYTPYVVKNDFNGTLVSKSGYQNGLSDEIKVYLPKNEKNALRSVIFYADTKKKTTQFFQLENLDTKDAYTVFGGSNHPRYSIETPTTSKEVLMVFKDSYANSFLPFLAQDYRKIIVIDPRYCFEDIDTLMNSEGVTQVLFLYNANTFFNDTSLAMSLEVDA